MEAWQRKKLINARTSAIARCTTPRYKKRYADRGITMHFPWLVSQEAWLAEVPPPPTPKHTLDRIENNLGYFPGNIRWATWKEQYDNRTIDRQLDGSFRSL